MNHSPSDTAIVPQFGYRFNATTRRMDILRDGVVDHDVDARDCYRHLIQLRADAARKARGLPERSEPITELITTVADFQRAATKLTLSKTMIDAAIALQADGLAWSFRHGQLTIYPSADESFTVHILTGCDRCDSHTCAHVGLYHLVSAHAHIEVAV